MYVSYPAIFYKDIQAGGYTVYFPDLNDVSNACTQGDTVSEAMLMASEFLGIVLSGELEEGHQVPSPSNINELSVVNDDPFKDDSDMDGVHDLKNSFVSMVGVDLTSYIETENKELVKKTLSIPRWANDLGNRLGINFSKELTEVIIRKTIKSL